MLLRMFHQGQFKVVGNVKIVMTMRVVKLAKLTRYVQLAELVLFVSDSGERP